jgi:hypothetical protein
MMKTSSLLESTASSVFSESRSLLETSVRGERGAIVGEESNAWKEGDEGVELGNIGRVERKLEFNMKSGWESKSTGVKQDAQIIQSRGLTKQLRKKT